MTTKKPVNPPPDQPAQRLVDDRVESEDLQVTTETDRRDRGRLRSAARVMLRILVALIIVAGLGFGIYYGWPFVYDRYIRPVEVNTTDVGAIQERVDLIGGQLAELQASLATTQTEIATIEDGLGELSGRIESLEVLIAAHTDRLVALDDQQAVFEAAIGDAGDATLRQINILKAMELLSRARLFLYQANYGLAEQDIGTARNILADLAAPQSGDDAKTITDTVSRLDLALAALPARPVLASDDLDIAWQTLLGQAEQPVRENGTFESTTTTTSP